MLSSFSIASGRKSCFIKLRELSARIPRAENLEARNAAGRVVFHNAGMKFDIDSVDYDQIAGARAAGKISDFNKPRLELDISTTADASPAVQTWLDTPVGKRNRSVMQNIDSVQGAVQTQIGLEVPLTRDD